jgi:hypothetical protein
MKTMLITLFDVKGNVHFEFIPRGQAVNRAYYLQSGHLKLCIGKSLNFDPTIGFSTMTKLQLSGRSLPSSFWPKVPLLK